MRGLAAAVVLLVLALMVLTKGDITIASWTEQKKPDPVAWCDAPPVDGAGAPEACN